MATYTCTVYNGQPKAPHTGVQHVSGTISLGATAASVGDVFFLAKLPNGAKVVDFQEYHTTGATAFAISLGLARGHSNGGIASLSCYLASGAQATANRMSLGLSPSDVSLSASDPTGFGILSAKVESGTMTTSFQLHWSFSYRVDAV
jgi:hypothetical protein